MIRIINNKNTEAYYRAHLYNLCSLLLLTVYHLSIIGNSIRKNL